MFERRTKISEREASHFLLVKLQSLEGTDLEVQSRQQAFLPQIGEHYAVCPKPEMWNWAHSSKPVRAHLGQVLQWIHQICLCQRPPSKSFGPNEVVSPIICSTAIRNNLQAHTDVALLKRLLLVWRPEEGPVEADCLLRDELKYLHRSYSRLIGTAYLFNTGRRFSFSSLPPCSVTWTGLSVSISREQEKYTDPTKRIKNGRQRRANSPKR